MSQNPGQVSQVPITDPKLVGFYGGSLGAPPAPGLLATLTAERPATPAPLWVGAEESRQILTRTPPPRRQPLCRKREVSAHPVHVARPRSPPRFLQTARWLGNTSRPSPWQPHNYPQRPGTLPAGWPAGGKRGMRPSPVRKGRGGRRRPPAAITISGGCLKIWGSRGHLWTRLCPPPASAPKPMAEPEGGDTPRLAPSPLAPRGKTPLFDGTVPWVKSWPRSRFLLFLRERTTVLQGRHTRSN